MKRLIVILPQISTNKKARITNIQGGHVFQKRLCTMGIRENQEIKVISRQPFHGPLTVEICGSQMTLGRGMAQKILVEMIE